MAQDGSKMALQCPMIKEAGNVFAMQRWLKMRFAMKEAKMMYDAKLRAPIL